MSTRIALALVFAAACGSKQSPSSEPPGDEGDTVTTVEVAHGYWCYTSGGFDDCYVGAASCEEWRGKAEVEGDPTTPCVEVSTVWCGAFQDAGADPIELCTTGKAMCDALMASAIETGGQAHTACAASE